MKVIHKRYDLAPATLVDCLPDKDILSTEDSLPEIEELYPYQKQLIGSLLDGKSILVSKARRVGMTTTAILYAVVAISQRFVRPNIITTHPQMKKIIENQISDRVGNTQWKQLPVGWLMVDETKVSEWDRFRGYDPSRIQVFAYTSSLHACSNIPEFFNFDEIRMVLSKEPHDFI